MKSCLVTVSTLFLIVFIISNVLHMHHVQCTSSTDEPTWKFNMQSLQKVLTEGKQHIEKIQSQSLSLTYAACYQNLMEQFQDSCQHLYSQDKFRLALAMYNCQREEAGFTTLRCTPEDSIEQCAERMGSESNAFQTVVLLTHHVENMCYFVQSSQFEKQASSIINALASQSLKTTQILYSLNEHHEMLKKQVGQTLAEQMKAYREHEKVTASIGKLQEQNEAHNERTKLQHEAIMERSNEVVQNLVSMKELNEQLSQHQKDMNSLMNNHFEDTRKRQEALASSMEESIVTSRSIAQHQKKVSDRMETLNADQKSLFDKLTISNEKQDILLKGQLSMLEAHRQLHESTQKIQSGVEESAQNMRQMIDQSMEHYDSLQGKMTDMSQQQEKLETIQEKTLQNAERGFSNLERASQAAAESIHSMHEEFKSEFGRMYEFLHHIFTILSSLDFKMHTWMSVVFYAMSCIVVYLVTMWNVLSSARGPLLLLLVICMGVEFFFTSYLSPMMTRTLHVGLGLYSLYMLHRSYGTYEDISRQTLDAVLYMCNQMEGSKYASPSKVREVIQNGKRKQSISKFGANHLEHQLQFHNEMDSSMCSAVAGDEAVLLMDYTPEKHATKRQILHSVSPPGGKAVNGCEEGVGVKGMARQATLFECGFSKPNQRKTKKSHRQTKLTSYLT